MNRRIVVIVMALLLQACGVASTYEPKEYSIEDGNIENLQVTGSVNVVNTQDSSIPLIVYARNSTTTLSSDLKTITDAMVNITKRELSKSNVLKKAGNQKTIELKVISLLSKYKISSGNHNKTPDWKSNLIFQAKLGNGTVIETTVPYSTHSSIGSLNRNIAEAVKVLLNDQKVRLYLEQ